MYNEGKLTKEGKNLKYLVPLITLGSNTMGYFDDEKNVQDYIEMVDGYDGAALIKVLQDYLPDESALLELGMGPGKDLDILNQCFKATGSDISQVFINLYREKHPEADLLLLDAVTLDTDRTFNCIYSNKVLHHLTKDELQHSLCNQTRLLRKNGLLFHSFWHGDKEEMNHGLRFVYYLEEELKAIVDGLFEVVKMERYKEIEEDDSFYVILKKIDYVANEILEEVKNIQCPIEELDGQKSEKIRNDVKKKYVHPSYREIHWENFVQDLEYSFKDENGWYVIQNFPYTKPVLMFFNERESKFMFRFNNLRDVSKVYGETFGYEFYLTNEDSDFLICFNHHDYLIGLGKAYEWVQKAHLKKLGTN